MHQTWVLFHHDHMNPILGWPYQTALPKRTNSSFAEFHTTKKPQIDIAISQVVHHGNWIQNPVLSNHHRYRTTTSHAQTKSQSQGSHTDFKY
jgi:hypothetical protein